MNANKGFPLGQFIVCKEIPIRGFDLLLQSCTTQRQAGIFVACVAGVIGEAKGSEGDRPRRLAYLPFFFTNDEHGQRDIFPREELSLRLRTLWF